MGAGLEGYPFDEMTQVYKYRAEVGSNWKLFIDAFAEFYHAPVLHAKQATDEESRKLQGYGYEALAYDDRRAPQHGLVVGWHVPAQGSRHGQADRERAPQRAVRSVGPPRHRRARRPATGAQPGPAPGLGRRLVRVLPELHAARVGAGLVPHVPLLADVVQHAHLRGHPLLRPPDERHRAAAPGARGGDVQGVRAPGRQHARGHAVDDRVAGGHRVPAQRPGGAAAPPAHDGPRLRRRLPAVDDTPVRISAAS